MFQVNNSKIRKIANKNGAGFTLIELMVVIFVVTVGLLGIYTVSVRIISYTNISLSRLTASYLAQEGIEIVRNIRDTNWLEKITQPTNSWDEGLTGCSLGCEADYLTPANLDPTLPLYGAGRFLNINASGFYSYSAGTQTKFKRKITIEPSGTFLKVKVFVQWQERGASYEAAVQENLYEWYNPQI